VDLFITVDSCVLSIGFNDYLYVRTPLESYLAAVFIRQRVVDPYFAIQMIPPFHGDLCFFWLIRKWGLDYSFDLSRQDSTRFFRSFSLTRRSDRHSGFFNYAIQRFRNLITIAHAALRRTVAG
jgi:hypothetical protein